MNLLKYLFLLAFVALFSCNNSSADQSGEALKNDSSPAAQTEIQTAKKKNIVFFGNSLTAAYGLNPSEGYVALIQQRLDSLGLPYNAITPG
jgi:acyl-CoA thioesterase I